ncbi:MAG: YeaC family protein [Chromatocurvus sp.]
MDEYDKLVGSLTPEIYERLKRAVETGRWPDGRAVTAAQREHCLNAIIAWGQSNLKPEERIGFIDRGRKGGATQMGAGSEQPLRWQDDHEKGGRGDE